MSMSAILVITILLPLVGAVGIWPIARTGGRDGVRWWALVNTLTTFALACYVVYGFFQAPANAPNAPPGYYAWFNQPWLGSTSGLDIRFTFALDGISLWLFALSALLMISAVLVSWTAIKENTSLFYAMLLLLETGCLGVFSAQDIILFYVFFEFTLIPLFFLIGVWGSEQRRYAAVKFFIYTLAGSVLTFLGLLTIVFWASGYIGTAGAFNPGAGVRPVAKKTLPLTFEIPTIAFRLNSDDKQGGQYTRMLESVDRDRNEAISYAEAMIQPESKLNRSDRTFRKLVFDKLDADSSGRLSRGELISGQNDAQREGADILYTGAFFRAHDTDGDGQLTLQEIARPDDEFPAEQQQKLLSNLGYSDPPAEEELASWSVEPDEFGAIETDKLVAATGWEMSRTSFQKIPRDALQKYGSWSLSVAEMRASDFPLQMWVFLALFIGFAIKVPLFPLHTWLPLAHVQAPTAGSVFLAGILLKIGTYGFLRFNIPLLPDATAVAMPWLLWLSVAGIIYGALVALAQSDIKKLIAYSSVSHLGFCMLGLFALNALGTQGALLQMVNHGISTGALFALVGMLYERYHTRQIKDLGGIARTAPWMAFFMIVFTMSSIGLPGLNGFAGEFLILIGMFQRGWTNAPGELAMQYKVISVLAVAGVVLGAWYMLWLVQRVFFGPLKTPHVEHASGDDSPQGDLTFREIACLTPLAVLALWIGLWPEFFLAPMQQPLARQTAAARSSVEVVIEEESAIAQQPPDAEAEPFTVGRIVNPSTLRSERHSDLQDRIAETEVGDGF